MELQIVPGICKASKDDAGADVAPLFTGSVTIKVPTMPESYKFKAKYGRRTTGMMSEDKDKGATAFATMELLAEIAEEIQPFFTKVELTEIATNKAVDSVDMLYSYEPAFPVISDVAMRFIQGFAEKN
jgi:hypothetical protein